MKRDTWYRATALRVLTASALVVAVLFTSVWFSGLALRHLDYGYAVFYHLLDIEQTIEQFAPQNRFRDGFGKTDAAQHRALFRKIRMAIHDGGEGLEEIEYSLPDGRSVRLLHEAEIIHLQSVARLFTGFDWIRWGLMLLLPLVLWSRCAATAPLAPLRVVVPALLLVVAGITLLVFAFGPTRLFYLLHEWAFPPGEQWFFYYQDSLMTTLMQAPNIFGAITVAWAFAAVLLFILIYGMCRFLVAWCVSRGA